MLPATVIQIAKEAHREAMSGLCWNAVQLRPGRCLSIKLSLAARQVRGWPPARLGTHALCRKPTSSKRHPAHPVFPCLLQSLAVGRANQVWALDITSLPMARGWVYLEAVAGMGQPPGAGAQHVGHDLLRSSACAAGGCLID
ncbi:MAG: hypothetical protein IPF94_07115 [Betaproteobacteria bacterium]|nr:hypothetical protein [Betaproteobacteria bacterium]